MPKITVEKFLSLNEEKNNFLKVRLITDSIGMNNEIISYEVNRPGMALFGYFKDFAFERIQIFGKGEGNYVLTLAEENRLDIFEELFKYKMPLCIFTYNLNPPESFIKIAEKNNVCVIISELKTMDMIRNIENLIEEELIESHTVHGGF